MLERIREIRTSERRYYQKITDIYAECSADYDPKSEDTKLFFKMVQNMMHLAVTHHTAAEIIYQRLIPSNLTWDLPRGRKLLTEECKSLIPSSQKNYLSDSELSQLNLITTAFLDMAESRAARHIVSTMDDWKKFLQQYLATMDYERAIQPEK